MNAQRFSFTVLVLLLAGAAAAEPPTKPLNWLVGCWAFERDDARYEEVWLNMTADGTVGLARTIRANGVVNYETTRLEINDAGDISYVAVPSDEPSANFPLLTLDDGRAVFERKSDGFPKRIIYAYTPPDRLDARIEGDLAGKAKAIDYPFRRAKCPSAQ